MFLMAVPGLAQHFKRVPDQYVTSLEGDVQIACLCGAETSVRPGEMVRCECPRLFVGLHGSALSYRPPEGVEMPEVSESWLVCPNTSCVGGQELQITWPAREGEHCPGCGTEGEGAP